MVFTSRHYRFFRENILDRSVRNAERILETSKNAVFAGDVNHSYEDKYCLVEYIVNTAIASVLNALENLEGFDDEVFGRMVKIVQQEQRTVTLQYKIETECKFIKQTGGKRESSPLNSFQKLKKTIQWNKEDKKSKTKSIYTTHKIMHQEMQFFHWKVGSSHRLILFSETDIDKGVPLGMRHATTEVITKRKNAPFSPEVQSRDMNLTWLFKHIDPSNLQCCFSIDRERASTPRRNKETEEALAFMGSLQIWSRLCKFMKNNEHQMILLSNPETPHKFHVLADQINGKNVFVPILPLFMSGGDVDSPLLSPQDTQSFLEEQCHSLGREIEELVKNFPPQSEPGEIVSGYEAKLLLVWSHLADLSQMCIDGIEYVECILYDQLVQAIGKEVDSKDFDEYLCFHNQRCFSKLYSPKPFCYSIRQPNQYPEGVVAILTGGIKSQKPIETFIRYIRGGSSPIPISIPLNAATTVEFIGDQYIHGWMETYFESQPKNENETFLKARACQFSSYLLVMGTMSGPSEFSPKDAIILQNRDEVLIPLLTKELPTAKQFKDAIKSLSPEQVRFAKSFRAMQLGSSIFCVCVIQIKPQLETLLNLPPNSLLKEIRLVRGLLMLFQDYQIPSSLVSYDGPEVGVSREEKVSGVKSNVAGVMSVIDGVKDKEMENERANTDLLFHGRASSSKPVSSMEQQQQQLQHQQHRQLRRQQRRQQQQDPGVADSAVRHIDPNRSLSCRTVTAVSQRQCNACGICAEFVPDGMIECRNCDEVEYCSNDCLVWDWERGHKAECRSHSLHQSEGDQDAIDAVNGNELQNAVAEETDLSIETEASIDAFDNGGEGVKHRTILTASYQDAIDAVRGNELKNAVAFECVRLRATKICYWRENEEIYNHQDYEDERVSLPRSSSSSIDACSNGLAHGGEEKGCHMHKGVEEEDGCAMSFESWVDGDSSCDDLLRDGNKGDNEDAYCRAQLKKEKLDIINIPRKMDRFFETLDKENALRTIIISSGDQWIRKRKKNLLATNPKSFTIEFDDQKIESNKGLDLLDALSRSGSLPIASGELHVLIGIRHSFERNVMATVIEKNMNPIEKVEYSSLLIASLVHDVNIPTLIEGSVEPMTTPKVVEFPCSTLGNIESYQDW